MTLNVRDQDSPQSDRCAATLRHIAFSKAYVQGLQSIHRTARQQTRLSDHQNFAPSVKKAMRGAIA
jgi:hypothetical protein